MPAQVALIHTSATMIPVFKPLAAAVLGDAEIVNMVDESLLRDIIRDGTCGPNTARRVVGHVQSAEQAGASHILVTCSSVGRAVEAAAQLSGATVMRVDVAMADAALRMGKRIGVAATLPSTLAPTVDLLKRRATEQGLEVQISPILVEGAFAAVMSGDGSAHDRLVGDAVKKLAAENDVVVLAQASMARVVDALPDAEKRVPILSSPRLALEELARRIAAV